MHIGREQFRSCQKPSGQRRMARTPDREARLMNMDQQLNSTVLEIVFLSRGASCNRFLDSFELTIAFGPSSTLRDLPIKLKGFEKKRAPSYN